MKKTILYISASTLAFGLLLTNCSKKSDPAPAAATSTTGTTTTGTTTSGTTTNSSTTGSTTTSTTAGSTTSTTSSGSTTSSTTAGSTTSTSSGTTTSSITLKGTGTFTVDGVNYSGDVMFIPNNIDAYTVACDGNNIISIQASIISKTFKDGTYPILSPMTRDSEQASIVVVDRSGEGGPIQWKQYWSNAADGGTVTISGKTVSFSNIKLKLNADSKVVITVSAKMTIE